MDYLTGSKGFLGSHLKDILGDVVCIPHETIPLIKLKDVTNFYFLSTYGNLSSHTDENKIIQANITDLVTILKQIDWNTIHSFVYVSSSSVKRKVQTVYSRTKKAAGRSGSGAATIDAPTITTVNANAFHVVCGYADTSGLTVSGPVGYDLQAQPANEPQGVVTKVIASPSATGAITMTASGNSPMVGLSFAVKSAAVAGGTVTRIIANPVASISS